MDGDRRKSATATISPTTLLTLQMNDSSRHIIRLIILSFGMLLLLSAVPWSRLTNNAIKDFDLFEDLFPSEQAAMNSSIPVDPELQSLLDDAASSNAGGNGGATATDSLQSDSIRTDSTMSDSIEEPQIIIADAAPVRDGVVLIENYTGSDLCLPIFRLALTEAGSRRVRVAVLGDSYIEGDIFCQDLRDLLQKRIGGEGVGYMAMFSEFPGFRRSVRQSGSGWEMHDIRNLSSRDTLRTLSGCYAKSSGKSKAKFEGTKAFDGTRSWTNSSFVFISPDSGTIILTASDGVPYSFNVGASPHPQILSLPGLTTSFTVESDINRLVGLGTYLDGSRGIQLDCMSVRGNSGMGLRSLRKSLSTGISELADYDLIILEFGMNAISPGQTDYTSYGHAMEKAIAKVKECYPKADIILMGVGDRGAKKGSVVKSLPAVAAMIQTQRETAHKCRIHFWDTRAAMGGEDAVVDWRSRKLLNADYIHLNHAGGAELAKLFDSALQKAVNE